MIVTEFFASNNRTTFFSDGEGDKAWKLFWEACKAGEARTVELIRNGEVIAWFTRPDRGGYRYVG